MKCNNCNLESDNFNLFCKDTYRKSGYKNWCKKCQNAKSLEYGVNNKNKISEKRREKYAINKEKEKQYYIDRMNKNVIRFRAEVIYHGMQGSARQFGTEFDREIFSIDNIFNILKTLNVCPCCHELFIFESLLTGHKNMKAPTADRKDSNGGYTKNNVVFICCKCNRLKRDTSIEELKTIINWLESKI